MKMVVTVMQNSRLVKKERVVSWDKSPKMRGSTMESVSPTMTG